MTRIERVLHDMLLKCISDDYVNDIEREIKDDVIDDIVTSADVKWNEDDMRLAIGRVLIQRLGIER